jgi:hypothetical protein
MGQRMVMDVKTVQFLGLLIQHIRSRGLEEGIYGGWSRRTVAPEERGDLTFGWSLLNRLLHPATPRSGA